ncbi:class I SAM-dependent methyltransferase [Alcaligenes aquatilis]|uniref:class I SAM-dependent methyltransferase n=1 Tax=Alcaligenes aquatilis TaxID=323284 RepID=UPI000F6592F6|nr:MULTISPECIES: class I SAM-dependent methyltransferase [Alcaligenes]QXR36869.1 class I SAM-dependent methyltransferase [Alcaligenes aquatilis]
MKETSRRTVNHYQDHAQAYRDGTWDHDVSQNRDALLAAIGLPGPVDILDLGCGPGRDLAAFQAMGHRPVGLDGCAAFVEMARQQTGLTVLHQDFLDLNLPAAAFDGVFANAVLFHIPSAELSAVLTALRHSLRPGGVLFSSNPRGQGQEGWNGQRYGCYYSWEQWSERLEQAGFEYIKHFYRPTDRPVQEQHWLASLWRVPAR